jgi:Transposase DDE domain
LAFKKKLYQCRPTGELTIQTQRTVRRTRTEPCDPASLQRGVRQLLADKVSGNLVGLWLLIPEHLRLGTWDLLCGWTAVPGDRVEPRLALQMVHEAALCTTGLRHQRVLSQRGMELANGLPFVASDMAIHNLLAQRTVAESQRLQVTLGRIRRASGDYQGKLLAIDPHRIRSYSKRQMRRRCEDSRSRSLKVAQTFFALDPDTHQPLCFTTATAARTATTAAIELLDLAAQILSPEPGQTLVMADVEHETVELFNHVRLHTPFDLLVPMKKLPSLRKKLGNIPPDRFTRRWAGFSTLKQPYHMARHRAEGLFQLVQRTGERPEEYRLGAFLSTTDRDEVDILTADYPKRWHVEEFFNAHQALGWNRAGTMNLNIRYGQMTLALIAQTALHQLRRRLGEPLSTWDASHMAKSLLGGLEGDVRVHDDTIVVTYYNAPNVERLREHYQGFPARLKSENIDPRIPWLYDFKLDFRFR